MLSLPLDMDRDFNPFGGCAPGVDCPWYPSKLGENHCESSQNFAGPLRCVMKIASQLDCLKNWSHETHRLSVLPRSGIYNLRETAELCCKQYFGSQDLTTCIEASEADVLTEEVLVAFKAARPKRYYPDMFAKQNCVFDSDYYDWMASIDVSSFGEKGYFVLITHICDRRMRITSCSAPKKNAAIDGTRLVRTVPNYWYRLLRIK